MTTNILLGIYVATGVLLLPVFYVGGGNKSEGMYIVLSLLAAALWPLFLFGWFVGVMLARAGNRYPEVGE